MTEHIVKSNLAAVQAEERAQQLRNELAQLESQAHPADRAAETVSSLEKAAANGGANALVGQALGDLKDAFAKLRQVTGDPAAVEQSYRAWFEHEPYAGEDFRRQRADAQLREAWQTAQNAARDVASNVHLTLQALHEAAMPPEPTASAADRTLLRQELDTLLGHTQSGPHAGTGGLVKEFQTVADKFGHDHPYTLELASAYGRALAMREGEPDAWEAFRSYLVTAAPERATDPKRRAAGHVLREFQRSGLAGWQGSARGLVGSVYGQLPKDLRRRAGIAA